MHDNRTIALCILTAILSIFGLFGVTFILKGHILGIFFMFSMYWSFKEILDGIDQKKRRDKDEHLRLH